MGLTSEKSNEPKPESSGRRSFLLALFGVSGATVGALLAIPVVRFVTFPLTQERYGRWLVRSGSSGRLYLLSPYRQQKQLRWNVAMPGRVLRPRPRSTFCRQPTDSFGYCRPSVRIWDVLSDGWMLRTSSFARVIQDRSRPSGERIAGPPPRSMDSLESKVENGVLKVRYQYFRQIVPNKEVMA